MMLSNAVLAQKTFGNLDCGTWTKDRKNPQSVLTQINQVWVSGYVTALNIVLNQQIKVDVFGNIQSIEQIYMWIDNYCKANPLEDVGLGIFTLANELKKKK